VSRPLRIDAIGRLSLSSVMQFPATQEDCKTLAVACEAATFGRNKEDVLDESYRKAGKLDHSQFSIALEGSAGVSLERTAGELLAVTSDDLVEPVDVELYKLNVYGKSLRSFLLLVTT
jgi:hypothetical protein